MTTRKLRTPALDALVPQERATVLAELLAAHPELAEAAERLATEHLATADRDAVAEEVASDLRSLEVEDVWERTGRQPGLGYVHENEAASMVAEETVQPYVDDMKRVAKLGMHAAARELCLGILIGLYDCRDEDDDSALGRAPAADFTADHAGYVVTELRTAGLDLPQDALAAAVPDWAEFLERQAR
ncbi:MAG: hypothetical protein ACRDZ4_20615 [Egibacteraceae bacterium]